VWSQDDKYSNAKQFSADGKYMVFYNRHYGYWINDTMTGKCISTCKNHNSNYIDAMCFSHNNQLIASGDNDWFRVIDRLNGNCVLESSDPDRRVYHVHFSHDDRLCISVTDIAVHVWELDSKQVLHTLKTPHLSLIRDAIFSPDDKTILSSHEDGRCIIWDIATGKPIKTLYSSASLKIRNVDFTKLDASSSFTDAQREQLRSMGGIITTT
jgi:WD40 repeat protein